MNSVKNQALSPVWCMIELFIESQVSRQVKHKVYDQVEEQVRHLVLFYVWDQIKD
jgi:hypothetical protein